MQAANKLEKGEWAYTAPQVADRLMDTVGSSALAFGMMDLPAIGFHSAQMMNGSQTPHMIALTQQQYNQYLAWFEETVRQMYDAQMEYTDTVAEAQKTAQVQLGEYRLNYPQNVALPTVPIIEMSIWDIPGVDQTNMPTVGDPLQGDAVKRARVRLGLDKSSAVYIPASNVMRDGSEYVLKITKATLNKMVHPAGGGSIPVESIVVLDNIERIANNGVWFDGKGDREGRTQIAGVDYMKTTVYIDGDPYEVKMRVRLVETVPGQGVDNVLYYFTPEEILTIEKLVSVEK